MMRVLSPLSAVYASLPRNGYMSIFEGLAEGDLDQKTHSQSARCPRGLLLTRGASRYKTLPPPDFTRVDSTDRASPQVKEMGQASRGVLEPI